MNDSELPPPVWVDRTEILQAMLNTLEGEKQLGVDTESNSLFAYQERVCLIQISGKTQDFLIDPLNISSLEPLGKIFADANVEKIFHAAEYDIICLKRDFGFEFQNLFDTMLAARILGKPSFGLGAMLEENFGLHLEKKHQRANWGLRPLSAGMLDYARMDSHFLIALREKLGRELSEKGLMELAQEDFDRECHVEAKPMENNGCWKIPGSRRLEPRQAAILNELYDYREKAARRMDQPVFKVMQNELLLELATAAPKTREELLAIPKLNPKIVLRHEAGILAAVEKGSMAPLQHKPKPPRKDENYLTRLDALKEWRKKVGEKQAVESDVILPKEIMEEVAVAGPKTEAELAWVMRSVPYRFNHYGKKILKIVKETE